MKDREMRSKGYIEKESIEDERWEKVKIGTDSEKLIEKKRQ